MTWAPVVAACAAASLALTLFLAWRSGRRRGRRETYAVAHGHGREDAFKEFLRDEPDEVLRKHRILNKRYHSRKPRGG